MLELLFLCAGLAAQQPALEPLPIALPKPMFEGTPVNIKVPNLETPLGKPRPAFLAPAGAKNVARGKPVVSSTLDPTAGNLEQITDGDREGKDGSYVELGAGVQHITIDLGANHTIYALLLWHYHKQPRVFNDVVIRVAADPDFLTGVRTVFNNDHDNSAGLGIGAQMNYIETAEGKLVDARGVEARYVRLYSNGSNASDLNQYIEVEVFGKPLE